MRCPTGLKWYGRAARGLIYEASEVVLRYNAPIADNRPCNSLILRTARRQLFRRRRLLCGRIHVEERFQTPLAVTRKVGVIRWGGENGLWLYGYICWVE